MTDGQPPTDAVRDLGVQIDQDAAAMVNRVLGLAKAHEKAVHRAADEAPLPEAKPTP